MNSLAGMARHTNLGWFGDRGSANMLKSSHMAAKRGLLLPGDYETFLSWLGQTFLTKYLSGAGHGYSYKDLNSPNPKKVFQVFNGLYWILPAAFDSLETLKYFGLHDERSKMEKIVENMSNWMADILSYAGNFQAGKIVVDESIEQNESAPGSLLPYIKGVDYILEGFEYWAYRAVSVASHVLGGEKLKEEAKKIRSNHEGQTEWFVDYKGNYVEKE
jgi:hypothetical protein